MSIRKRFFLAASYVDWICSNTDDLWLILFPDMGDFVPNRNFDQKLNQNPVKSPTSHMSKLWMLAIFGQNSRKQMSFLRKTWIKSNVLEKNIVLNAFLRFWGFQKCPWCPFYHIWNSFNLNFENCLMENHVSFEIFLILTYDWWVTLLSSVLT